MGIFDELGRRVEQFKQEASAVAESGDEYQCRECESRFHVAYEECPECGAEDVVARTDE